MYEDKDDLPSLTIELDVSDEELAEDDEFDPNAPRFYIQYEPKHVQFRVSYKYTIKHLTEVAKSTLQDHLNFGSFSSVANWEHLASRMGVSNETILVWQKQPNPTSLLLQKCCHENVMDLLDSLLVMNRIDTLYDLKELNDSNLLIVPNELIKKIVNEYAEYANNPTVQIESFFFFVHYCTNKAEKKAVKWLENNLANHALNSKKIPIINIREGLNQEHPSQWLQEHFKQASMIIVCFTPSLAHILKSKVEDSIEISICKHAHQLMDNEFNLNQARNTRFRLVKLDDLPEVDLPIGWASSTTCFRFPNQSKYLFERLFLGKQPITYMTF